MRKTKCKVNMLCSRAELIVAAHATNGTIHDMRQGYFVFHDLSIATEGRYRLEFTLQEMQMGCVTTLRGYPAC